MGQSISALICHPIDQINKIDFKNKWNDQIIFKKIADVSLDDNHIGFQLCTQGYNSHASDSMKTQALPPWYKGIKFKTMKIVIKDSKNRRAPVVRSLEIWGCLSDENEPDVTKQIRDLMKTENKVSFYNAASSEDDDTSPIATSSATSVIPDEFLDSITNELLVMPFTLPSGNIVDESTIEKHNRNEEVYGRLPSDPFTGVCYTIDRKPMFDAALKVRLDEFKTRQCDIDEVKKSGRTVGKRSITCEPSTSKADNSQQLCKKVKIHGNNVDSLINEMYRNNQVSNFTQPRNTSNTNSSQQTRKCSKCHSNSNQCNNNFYRINLCSHEYCRNCIQEIERNCLNCKVPFQSSDIEKINL